MAVSSYLDIRAIEQVPLRERGLAANTYAALQHCALANAEAPALSFVLADRRAAARGEGQVGGDFVTDPGQRPMGKTGQPAG